MASSTYATEHPASRHHAHHPSAPQPVLIEPPGSIGADRKLDGRGLRFAIISTRWYDKEVIHPLVQGCIEELLSKGVQASDIDEYRVPGAYEMPFVASRLIKTKSKKQKKQQDKPGPHEIDAVICIGCMVKGGTMAYEFVSEATVMGLMKLNVMCETPVVLGLLTCKSVEQAKQCGASLGACIPAPESHTPSGSHPSQLKPQCNHGVEWAQEAIELAHLKRSTAELLALKANRSEQCNQADCSCSCHCQSCKCKTCTCTECECKSCYHNVQSTRQQAQEDRKMMQQFDTLGVTPSKTGASAEAVVCAGCSKSAQNCACRDCNCASCASKSAGSASTDKAQLDCRTCGKQQQECECTRP